MSLCENTDYTAAERLNHDYAVGAIIRPDFNSNFPAASWFHENHPDITFTVVRIEHRQGSDCGIRIATATLPADIQNNICNEYYPNEILGLARPPVATIHTDWLSNEPL